MQPFTVLTAVAAPLEIAKIDTGMILPGRYMRRHRRPGTTTARPSSTTFGSTKRAVRAATSC